MEPELHVSAAASVRSGHKPGVHSGECFYPLAVTLQVLPGILIAAFNIRCMLLYIVRVHRVFVYCSYPVGSASLAYVKKACKLVYG